MKKTVKFGIIGCGLMGKEFASASSRWCHLLDVIPKPEIVAVCDVNEQNTKWFLNNIPTVKKSYNNHKKLLADPEVEAVYCAVPHHLHEQIYKDTIKSGKHLMGEKPFGIDLKANQAIIKTINEHPQVFVRCASEFPYFPAMQEMINWINDKKFGRIFNGHGYGQDVRVCSGIGSEF